MARSPGARQDKLQDKLHGSLDEPLEGTHVGPGRLVVRGWVAHRSREVTGVVVKANGLVVGGAQVRLPRPDVAAMHPEFVHASTSGWSTEVELGDLSELDGQVEIEVYAVLAPRAEASRPAVGASGLGPTHLFAARTLPLLGGDNPGIRGGCFIIESGLNPGFHKIHGLAEAPGGVSAVEVFCDGWPMGRARTALPGRFEGADQGPSSGLALFERAVEVPEGKTHVEFTATVIACSGETFHVRPWQVRVYEPDPDDWSHKRLDLVRERTTRDIHLARQSRAASDRGDGTGALRVLVATHDLGLGGGQLYLQELLKRLASRGVECFVVSPRGGRLLQELEDLGMRVLITGDLDPHAPESYEAQVRQIALWAAGHGCQVALVNTMSAFPGVDAAQRLDLEVVWAIHESFPVPQFWEEAYPRPRPTYLEERAQSALSGTCRAVFEAAATLDLYEPWLPAGAGEVVPYGVDFSEIDDYRATADRDAIRAELGLPKDTLVLLCLGTIEARKAQINIAQAFVAAMRTSDKDVRLVLVGAKKGSPYVDALEDFLEQSGETRVRVEPLQPDTYRWYHAADVLVSGSDVESLPRSMIEAMAFERPIASTDVFGVPDLVTDGADGFLCRARDVNAMQAMLERVIATPAPGLVAMGRHARETVLSRHDPEIYAAYYFELLTSLAAED